MNAKLSSALVIALSVGILGGFALAPREAGGQSSTGTVSSPSTSAAPAPPAAPEPPKEEGKKKKGCCG